MVEFNERIEKALSLSGKTWEELRVHLDITYQAMKKLMAGTSKTLNAGNCAKAARFLEVDCLWLATGEGRPRPDSVWPFDLILPSQYKQLDSEFRRHIENDVAGEWMRVQQANGTHG